MNKPDQIIDNSLRVVAHMCNKFGIDESHAVKHSFEVFNYAKNIYMSECTTTLAEQQNVIYAAAILHDMCDKKYMDEQDGVAEIRKFASMFMTEEEVAAVIAIIQTMSYSKVKQRGFPELGKYQLAYHIVREADLLAAYDIDRCIMFSMFHENMCYAEALYRSKHLFKTRVLTYRSDDLFVTEQSKRLSKVLHHLAVKHLKMML